MQFADIGFTRSIHQYRKYSPVAFSKYSQVYLVQDTVRHSRCILTVIPRQCSQDSYEALITPQLHHPYLIRAIDAFEWGNFY
jgi:hypothetical protein